MATGPDVPVAWNLICVVTPVTDAVTSFGPRIVPTVHVATAWPVASVMATRGLVEPFPSVTASATA